MGLMKTFHLQGNTLLTFIDVLAKCVYTAPLSTWLDDAMLIYVQRTLLNVAEFKCGAGRQTVDIDIYSLHNFNQSL